MSLRRLLWLLTTLLLLSACVQLPLARPERATPTPTAVPHNPGVADLLSDPPAPGETVEVDAYFSGAGASPIRTGPPPPPDKVVCPTFFTWSIALTDRPFVPMLQFLNGTQSNTLPEDTPWLVVTTPDATQPGRRILPDFPYHARFWGHLEEPAFADCPDAGRIFVVEEVVTTYQEQPSDPSTYRMALPADYAAWPRYHDAEFGYSLPHPPDWAVEPLSRKDTLSAIALRAPQWPEYPVVVRVHAGETRYDQYDPSSAPALPFDRLRTPLQGEGWGVFEQGWSFGKDVVDTQGLAGYRVDREAGPGERAVSVLFSAHGYTYELTLRYPTGFDAPQPLLTAYSAIVESLGLDTLPGPTPTAPVKQELGAGPFLSQEEALTRAEERAGNGLELLDAQLLSEAEARRFGQPSPCGTFMGHPDGVWVLIVQGQLGSISGTYRLYLDATIGEQLCGEEINPDATPYPTMPPGTTATPAPRP